LLPARFAQPTILGRSLGVVVQLQKSIQKPLILLLARVQQGQLDRLA
jgi:hypothetical protein